LPGANKSRAHWSVTMQAVEPDGSGRAVSPIMIDAMMHPGPSRSTLP
jgi:hypothetical protein